MNELNIGDIAPDFEVLSDKEEKISLAKFKGQPIVLYFYPKDDTPGCTIEANEFSSLKEEFAAINCVVFGVSRDDVKSHCKFRDKYNLGVTLLSDTQEEICKLYDVLQWKVMFSKKYLGVERSTFLIDGNGKISKIWRKVKAEGHAKEVLEAATKIAA